MVRVLGLSVLGYLHCGLREGSGQGGVNSFIHLAYTASCLFPQGALLLQLGQLALHHVAVGQLE